MDQFLIKKRVRLQLLLTILFLGFPGFSYKSQAQPLRVGAFIVDASPPIGSPAAFAITRSITDSLSARGIVILSDQKPIVLCAVDWVGIANGGLDIWKERLAKAANTTVDRVSVHSLHQHDAPRCDFTLEGILEKYGLGGTRLDNSFCLRTIDQVALAVEKAKKNAQLVTHIGFGEAKVEKVASSRRVMGRDGKVAIIRLSSTTDSLAIHAPEGLIDPWLKCVSFWNEEKAVAVLTYYATHPMSYYGTGDVSCDFVGIGRNAFGKAIGVPCVHFNGAGGNIAAGKYNDGSPKVRPVLAGRMEAGMKKAWESTKKVRISGKDLVWKSKYITLPVASNLIADELRTNLEHTELSYNDRYYSAVGLAWLERVKGGHQVEVSSLRLGDTWLLNLPGELFVEYQLAAKAMKPLSHVCTAAYEEYGPRYIGIKNSYSEGGYEVTQSYVSPDVEDVLMNAIREVLK